MMTSNVTRCDVAHDLDQYLFPAVYITVIVGSIPANCASLVVSCLQIKKKNELGVYLFNLSVADLLYTLVLPLWVDYGLNHDRWWLGDDLCKMSVFLMHVNFYASTGFLTCISLDRYIGVVHPLKFHHLRTRKAATYICAVVWSVEILSNGMILHHQQTSNSTHNDTLCYDTFPMEDWKASFNIFRICVAYLLPLVIMAYCYKRIEIAVKHNQATADEAKKKIRKLLVAILSTFFLCFTPYHVLLLMRSIWEPGSCKFARIIFKPYKITLAIASLNCLADPILYCFVSETSRTEISTALKCCVEKDKNSVKQEFQMISVSNKNTNEAVSISRHGT
ncbi:psychosine receptor-like [Pleurodeles waltl]|uniref:psychosine receptor-like n=1 Tax=Pleurodeles waltl TaxID=8319 RepID=UPI0037094810